MSETYDWGELRAQACDRFGDTPGPALEARIVAVFADHPALVADAVDSVARGYDAGRVHSPWPMLATQVEREAERAARAHDVVASGAADRDKAYAQAERYIRQVGYLHQSEQELRDELAYRKWPVDERLFELWRLVRPIGERTEREQLERAERWKQGRLAMQDLGIDAQEDARTTQTVHSSQEQAPLTRVSDRQHVDVDADIAW